jgi:diguanylate cyclase (GGDEF)-like protein
MQGSPLGDRHRAARWIATLVVALGLIAVALASALTGHTRERDALDRALANTARRQSDALEHYFARARSLTQVTAANPAFREFYDAPGSRHEKIVQNGHFVRDANAALGYLEQLFPGSIGEACFIDRTGPENARAVRGDIAPVSELSPDESKAPFFQPTFALKPGEVYQARPYLSPDTHDWVVSNSTPLPVSGGATPAIVHFEISVDSFRREAAAGSRFDVAVVEANSGRVIVDSRYRQPAGDDAKLGRPTDRRFERMVSTGGRAFEDGAIDVGGLPAAFRAVGKTPNNANEWVVVALARAPVGSWVDDIDLAELVIGGLGLLLLAYSLLRLRASQSELRNAAMTDALTGLSNRRRLVADLEDALAAATAERPVVLAMFDLDGFKSYNDTFGHPAGDALLTRLAQRLNESMASVGTPYRMGGDEFCVLAPVGVAGPGEVTLAAERALSEHGEGFSVTCSYGSVLLPGEADHASAALHLADQRMYANKNSMRSSSGQQTTDVLVRVLAERYPELGEHLDGVTELAGVVAGRLGLGGDDLAIVQQAASLHDLGKLAVPDAILEKRGPLDEGEWEFIRQHTLIGERILAVAPALAPAARIVRASHERVDGGGYPDGLSGDEIPLAARIVCVCDAFDAMTSVRPYRPDPLSAEAAIEELRQGAGSQFDGRVVEVLVDVIRERARLIASARRPASVPSAAR